MTFNEKIALVTGGSRGIGRAVALALAAEGIAVAVNYVKEKEQAEEVCELIRAKGGKALAIQAHVSVSSEVQSLVETVDKELGTINILINNAGKAQLRGIEDISEEDFDSIIKTNLKSSFLVTQAVLPGMRKNQWGRIIMMSSVAAQIGGGVGLHYAASKAGQIAMMHFYAKALAAEGITVNAVAPALIETDMVSQVKSVNPDNIPVKRLGTSEEIANVVIMLVHNGYITNQTMNVNGGMHPSS